VSRRQLITSDVSAFDVHDHVAWCGDGLPALHEVAGAAFASALARNERLLFVCDEPDFEGLAKLGGLDDLDDLIANRVLLTSTVDETYQHFPDARAQQVEFESVLGHALRDGYTGICVVADNSRQVGSTDEEFARWLRWEATADRLQAARPVTGICYFDRARVPTDRLADLAAMHPVLSTGLREPNFRLFHDIDTVRLTGEVDILLVEQLRRLLGSLPSPAEDVFDLSDLEFVDHRGLRALSELARQGNPVRVRNARPIVRRVWDVIDAGSAGLEFC
jgi:hypothetical protein